jgi:MFS family permease
MASATIAPTLPAMHAAFSDLPNLDLLVRLVLTIPGLFIVLDAPAAGFIVDSYGRKHLLVVSTFLYAITGSAGYFFDSMTAILIGRALLGIAVAGVMISVTTLIADYYQGEARARFLGRQAAFMNFGGVLFTAAGGFLADVTWQTPFLIYLVAFVILPFTVIALLEPKRQEPEAAALDSENGSKVTFPIGQLLPIYITALVLLTAFIMMII